MQNAWKMRANAQKWAEMRRMREKNPFSRAKKSPMREKTPDARKNPLFAREKIREQANHWIDCGASRVLPRFDPVICAILVNYVVPAH